MEKEPITIKRHHLITKYNKIGEGDEGSVYNFNNLYALKILSGYMKRNEFAKLRHKYKKLKEMMNEKEENVALPLGFVMHNNAIIGYYMDLVKSNYLEDFSDLERINDKDFILDSLIKADEILQRLHKKGFIVGDLKEKNILIDKNNTPVFIDTDNYGYKDYFFDMIPDRAACLTSKYNGLTNYIDNDKLLFTLMALKLYTKNYIFNFHNKGDYIREKGLKKLDFDQEIKEELDCILSDSNNKPYTGHVLRKIKSNNK